LIQENAAGDAGAIFSMIEEDLRAQFAVPVKGKTKFRVGEPHQAAGNKHLRFLVVAGPKTHTSRMRNLAITALLLLSCCARFDEAKETERCQKAQPNDQVAADECFETSVLEWEKANAWVARITHRRPETP
jgi:hypothetical protein